MLSSSTTTSGGGGGDGIPTVRTSASGGGSSIIVNRSSSFCSDCSDDGGGINNSVTVRMMMMRKKKRNNRRSTTKSTSSPHNNKHDVIGGHRIAILFLMAGLFFCVLDWLYIFHYVMTLHLEGDVVIVDNNDNNNNGDNNGGSQQQQQQQQQQQDHHQKVVQPPPSQQRQSTKEEDLEEKKIRRSTILNDPDRAHIIQLLHDADLNVSNMELSKLEQIPKWDEVTALYGQKPVFVGLDTCKPFQNIIPQPEEHFVSTAGTFNTGTNLISALLQKNCYMPARVQKYGRKSQGVRWQVLWGKHTPVYNETFRLTHRAYNNSELKPQNMFPAVMVRDPYKWMQSMCRHEYAAEWPGMHKKDIPCPNLVYSNATAHWNDGKHKVRQTPTNGVPVVIHYHPTLNTRHDSLVGFWNDWYNQYAAVKWPRLLVRFEDLIFFPRQVTQTVCECAGGKLDDSKPFKYVTDSAKKGKAHGKEGQKTTYLDALVKYGTEKGRYNGYGDLDLQYANQYLDSNLMKLFQYKFPQNVIPSNSTTAPQW